MEMFTFEYFGKTDLCDQATLLAFLKNIFSDWNCLKFKPSNYITR